MFNLQQLIFYYQCLHNLPAYLQQFELTPKDNVHTVRTTTRHPHITNYVLSEQIRNLQRNVLHNIISQCS